MIWTSISEIAVIGLVILCSLLRQKFETILRRLMRRQTPTSTQPHLVITSLRRAFTSSLAGKKIKNDLDKHFRNCCNRTRNFVLVAPPETLKSHACQSARQRSNTTRNFHPTISEPLFRWRSWSHYLRFSSFSSPPYKTTDQADTYCALSSFSSFAVTGTGPPTLR